MLLACGAWPVERTEPGRLARPESALPSPAGPDPEALTEVAARTYRALQRGDRAVYLRTLDEVAVRAVEDQLSRADRSCCPVSVSVSDRLMPAAPVGRQADAVGGPLTFGTQLLLRPTMASGDVPTFTFSDLRYEVVHADDHWGLVRVTGQAQLQDALRVEVLRSTVNLDGMEVVHRTERGWVTSVPRRFGETEAGQSFRSAMERRVYEGAVRVQPSRRAPPVRAVSLTPELFTPATELWPLTFANHDQLPHVATVTLSPSVEGAERVSVGLLPYTSRRVDPRDSPSQIFEPVAQRIVSLDGQPYTERPAVPADRRAR
jgi:hypothetical protein